ncbi:MAG TPA: thiamine pyrophosphate-binding protein [Caulobacteraceae bacterium]|nr:thiamine pyrophosphate-binding protein [Caulobacteraceae bacterium]
MAMSGGERLARALAASGVRFVFGLPSPEVDPFLAALEPLGVRFVPIRHEAAGAYMAEGVWRTTGQPSATLTNPGPGTANLLPGLINARHQGVPIIAITAQHRLDVVYPSPPTTFQGQDQLDVFRAAVKWGGPILSRERIDEVVAIALREMWAGRPGPVQLEVPAPVMYATASGEAAEPPAMPRLLPQAGAAQIRAAAALLEAAQRPVIIAGAGVDAAGASEAAVALAERLDCPIITTMAGRSAAPQDHPNHLYGYGAGADTARREADILLALGTRLGNLDTPFDKYWGRGAEQKLIQIDIEPRNLGVSRPLSLGIIADLPGALADLGAALGSAPKPGAADRLARYRALEADWRNLAFAPTEGWNGAGLHPAQVMQKVAETFGREAIYAADGGFTSLWAHFMLPPTRPRSYLSILELGMLGMGIPAAIGAKLANPEREVVCVTGDGAAGFHCMELQSAARERLKLAVVVFAEGSWSMEVPNEMAIWGRTFGAEMGVVRWDKVAEGLGCAGFYAEEMDAVSKALAAARETGGPALVCVKTDREANMAVPRSVGARFSEVYQGPSAEAA